MHQLFDCECCMFLLLQDYFNEEEDDDRKPSTSNRPSSPELHPEGVGRPFVKLSRSVSPPNQRQASASNSPPDVSDMPCLAFVDIDILHSLVLPAVRLPRSCSQPNLRQASEVLSHAALFPADLATCQPQHLPRAPEVAVLKLFQPSLDWLPNDLCTPFGYDAPFASRPTLPSASDPSCMTLSHQCAKTPDALLAATVNS